MDAELTAVSLGKRGEVRGKEMERNLVLSMLSERSGKSFNCVSLLSGVQLKGFLGLRHPPLSTTDS